MRSRRNAVLAATLATIFAAGPVAVPAAALEPLSIGTTSLKDATLRLYGFVETDNIYDTTQSYNEEQDSVAPQTRTTSKGAQNIAGQRSRDEMSVRNSRLGLELNVPAQDNGIKGKAVFEMDMLGNAAVNTTPGNAPGTQTEGNYFNNPAMRVRHAYLEISKDEFGAKIGQTWSLLGWQPYYFPGEAVVMPGVGQLYRRFAQARAMDTHQFGDWTLESAIDAAKPAEMNSGDPEWHGGARIASSKYKGASISGASTSMVGLSAGVSGAVMPIRTQTAGNPTGGAIAVDVLVPIIPSADGKSRDNTLIWAAEGVTGTGVGGLEMAGLTFGVPGVSATGTSGAGTAIDSGIAGVDTSGSNVQLIRMRSYRTHFQYSLAKWSASVGYAQVEARNLDRFAAGAAALTLYPKLQYGYVAAFYDAASWLRFAGEVNQTKATFNDPNNRFARNNRYQMSAYFMF
jgi:hypothetical protein